MQTNQDLSFPRECERKFLLLCPHCADIRTVLSSSQSSRNMKNALLGANVSFILAIRECVFVQACDSVTQSELQRVTFWGLVRSRKIWTVGMSRLLWRGKKLSQMMDFERTAEILTELNGPERMSETAVESHGNSQNKRQKRQFCKPRYQRCDSFERSHVERWSCCSNETRSFERDWQLRKTLQDPNKISS